MKINGIRAVCLHIGVWVAVIILLFGVLTISALIPNSALQSNMEKSALYYADKEAFVFENDKKINSVSDNYADTILLGIAWNMGEEQGIRSVIDTMYYDGGELGENYGLYLSVTEGAEANTDYTRYWHGTAAFVRFLHLFTTVEGVKIIGFVALMLLCAATVALLIIRKHSDIAAILAISLCAVQIWNVRLSMEYQPAFIITFILCILYILMEKRSEIYLTLHAVMGGTAVCFFDFLTTETVTFLLPIMIVITVRAKEKRLGGFCESLFLILRCGVAWLGSYAFTFVAKWTFVSVITGENAFSKALAFAGERIGGDITSGDIPNTIFSSVIANFGTMFGSEMRTDHFIAIGPIVLVILALASVWYLFRIKDGEKTAAVLLFLLGSLVILRFLVLNNHSFIHCFFTYRALAATAFACLSALRLNIALPERKRGKK